MDCEKLISAVFERPIIWDKRNKLHANRNAVEKKWMEISQEMNCEDAVLKKKWKYLRDQFAIEWGKVPPARSGKIDDTQLPKWQYFKSLLFLKDIVTPRTTKGPLKALLGSNSYSPGPSQDLFEEESPAIILDQSSDNIFALQGKDALPDQASPEMIPPEPALQGKRKRKQDTIDEYQRSVLDIEERKLDYLMNISEGKKKEEEDSTLLFLKSLMPHINMIPKHDMLRFRRQMENLVEEFAYPQSSSSGSGSRPTSSLSTHYNELPDYRSFSYPASPQSSHSQHVQYHNF